MLDLQDVNYGIALGGEIERPDLIHPQLVSGANATNRYGQYCHDVKSHRGLD